MVQSGGAPNSGDCAKGYDTDGFARKQSRGHFCTAVVRQMVGEVIPTRVQLTFSQCQNFIADISVERNYTYFFWGHADVALLATSPEKIFAEEVRG